MRRQAAVLCMLSVLGGCAKESFPPAVPEEPGWAQPDIYRDFVPAPAVTTAWAMTQEEVVMLQRGNPVRSWREMKKDHALLRKKLSQQQSDSPALALTPARVEMRALEDGFLRPVSFPPVKPEKPLSPAKMVARANANCLVIPTRETYAGGQVTYQWEPGRCYLILVAPDHPTLVMLPHGETLADDPAVDAEKFDLRGVLAGKGEEKTQAFLITTFTPGFEVHTPLISHQGHTYFLRLRSVAKTGMLGVTWRLPEVPDDIEAQWTGPAQRQSEAPPTLPPLNDTRLHRGYTIEAIHNPAWVPTAVMDDGRLTQIRFARSLAFGSAPALFSVRANGEAGVVEWTAYEDHHNPDAPAYYSIVGVWPRLELRGGDGQKVIITRQAVGETMPVRPSAMLQQDRR